MYKRGSGNDGRGGQYYLYSGKINSVEIPLEADIILIYHTHPGGTNAVSKADQDILAFLQSLGSPQRSSQIVPVCKKVIRFSIEKKRY